MDYLYQLLEKILTIYCPKFIVIILDSMDQFASKNEQYQFLNLILENIHNLQIKVILSVSGNAQNINKQNVEVLTLNKMNSDEISMFINII